MRQCQTRTGAMQQFFRHVYAIRLDERCSRFQAHRTVERRCHRAADEQAIHFRKEGLDDIDLAGDLCATQDRYERSRWVVERATEIVELTLHQEAGNGRAKMTGHPFGGCMGAMRRAERIVDEEIAELSKLAGQGVIVLFFAWEKARILDEQDR